LTSVAWSPRRPLWPRAKKLGRTLRNSSRHVTADSGELPLEHRAENRLSLQQDFRLLSSCRAAAGDKICVITEADRSSTTLLLPGEY
jgi:hypothetical protein